MRRMWSRRTRYDFYFPAFANLGEQAVFSKEIYCTGDPADEDVFGYQERWAEYRYHPSLITGRFGIEPQQASKVATMIHQANFGATVSAYLDKFSPLYLDSDDDFTWDLVSNGKKNIPLIRASLTSGGSAISATDRCGENFTEFYLVFPEDWFADGEVIVGHLNQVYPFRILGDARFEGSNAVYKVELN